MSTMKGSHTSVLLMLLESTTCFYVGLHLTILKINGGEPHFNRLLT